MIFGWSDIMFGHGNLPMLPTLFATQPWDMEVSFYTNQRSSEVRLQLGDELTSLRQRERAITIFHTLGTQEQMLFILACSQPVSYQ